MDNTDKLAVLIDADNAQPGIVDDLLAEIAKYGLASVKRIYGDWTAPNLKGWKEVWVYADSCGLILAFLGNGGRNAATILSLRYSSSR